MPGYGDGVSTDLEGLDEAAASLPVTQGFRLGQEVSAGWDVTRGLVHGVAGLASDPGALVGLPSGVETPVDPDVLNQQYGVPGYLRFNAPASAYDAAFAQHMAFERQMRETALAHSSPSPLLDLGAGLAGALTDPTNVALAVMTGGLGEEALGAVGLGRAAEEGAAVGRVGRVMNAAAGIPRLALAGAIGNAPIVGADWALNAYAGDDESATDALTQLAAGAALHTGFSLMGKALGWWRNAAGAPIPRTEAEAAAQLAAFRGEAVAPAGGAPALEGAENGQGVDFLGQPRSRDELMSSSALAGRPAAIDALAPAARLGAWALALDRVAADAPVRVGELIARELDSGPVARLTEADALTDVPSWRPAGAATAVTPRGTEVPVRYGLVELGDLTTSHTDDMQVNPAYPPELQPRDRGRAGAYARNLQLESELNPKLLIGDVAAGAGAPIVAPDGTVESGNGRTIALRRAAAKDAPAWRAYVAELEAAGYDATGMAAPALVRMRTEPMTGAGRAALAHEMNADVVERMGPAEQAMADAKATPDQMFDLVEEGRSPWTSRGFARAFLEKVAPDQVGQLTDAEGRLSPEGARRIKAAVLARAYGDQRLVADVHEDEGSSPRRIAEALADAAPAWARLSSLVARGEVSKAVDATPAISSAMDLVRYAAAERIGLKELLEERLGQRELFGGESVSPATEAFLRLFFRNDAMTQPLAGEKIAAALKDYARMAAEVKAGPDLFGSQADEGTARQILDLAVKNLNDPEAAARLAAVRPAGPSRPGAEPREPPRVDVRAPGGERGGPAGAGRPAPEAGRGAGAEGEPEPAAGERPAAGEPAGEPAGSGASDAAAAPRLTGAAFIARDPELKALADDTARWAAARGIDLPAQAGAEAPDTIAEAIRAAAVCLAEEAE